MSGKDLWRALGLPELRTHRERIVRATDEPWGHYFQLGLHELDPIFVEHPSLYKGFYSAVCEVRCVGSDVHEAAQAYWRWFERQ